MGSDDDRELTFTTAFGPCGLAWSDAGLTRVRVVDSRDGEDGRSGPPGFRDSCAGMSHAVFRGRAARLFGRAFWTERRCRRSTRGFMRRCGACHSAKRRPTGRWPGLPARISGPRGRSGWRWGEIPGRLLFPAIVYLRREEKSAVFPRRAEPNQAETAGARGCRDGRRDADAAGVVRGLVVWRCIGLSPRRGQIQCNKRHADGPPRAGSYRFNLPSHASTTGPQRSKLSSSKMLWPSLS